MPAPKKMVYRTKRIYSGKYLEVEMYPVFTGVRYKRSKKLKVSSRKQKNLNDKNAKKHIVRLVHTNFTKGDFMITLTYDDKKRPHSEEQAKKDIDNFIRRLQRYIKKNKLQDLKYIAVIEYKEAQEGKNIKIHHHMIMNDVMSRDKVEKIWGKGYANTIRMVESDNGLEGITRYIIKDPQGKRRVKQSRNLKQPTVRVKDNEITKRTVNKFIQNTERHYYFQRKYKDYQYVSSEIYINDITGISVSAKMRKINNQEHEVKIKKLNSREYLKLIDTREPRGLFYYKAKRDCYIGINNLGGNVVKKEYKRLKDFRRHIEENGRYEM